jgi:hypothetical protein
MVLAFHFRVGLIILKFPSFEEGQFGLSWSDRFFSGVIKLTKILPALLGRESTLTVGYQDIKYTPINFLQNKHRSNRYK